VTAKLVSSSLFFRSFDTFSSSSRLDLDDVGRFQANYGLANDEERTPFAHTHIFRTRD